MSSAACSPRFHISVPSVHRRLECKKTLTQPSPASGRGSFSRRGVDREAWFHAPPLPLAGGGWGEGLFVVPPHAASSLRGEARGRPGIGRPLDLRPKIPLDAEDMAHEQLRVEAGAA